MHPAISVIFFTVTSGAGFGFIALLGLGVAMPQGPLAAFLIAGLAGSLSVAGLLASTFHLGHPERAWRAFSQWRSSWLSREGVAAVLTLALFGVYSLIWMVTGARIDWLGLLVAVGAVVTVFTTSMIYAQLKTVPQWHTVWTPLCYLGFSAVSGLLLSASWGWQAAAQTLNGGLLAAAGLVIAWGIKLAWWQAGNNPASKVGASTVESATGLGRIGRVRLFEKPHSGENYLTKEMVHRIGRKHAVKLRLIALLAGLLLPLLVCLVVYFAALNSGWIGLAFGCFLIGLFVERWLFFAEATHVVSLYY